MTRRMSSGPSSQLFLPRFFGRERDQPLARASAGEVASFRGVGPAKASLLLAAAEIAARLSAKEGDASATPRVVRDSESVYRLLRARLAHLRHEVFVVLLLDSRNRVLRQEVVGRGTTGEAPAHPREAFAAAIREGAAAVIFASLLHPASIV
jgi:DNA repair protein RadC